MYGPIIGIVSSFKNGAGITPIIVVNPVVSGNANISSVLTTTNGTWTNAPDAYTYQWYRGASLIASATSQTYTITFADDNQSITCQVTASKTGSAGSPATSNAISVISIAAISNMQGWFDVNNAANTYVSSTITVIKDKSAKARNMSTSDGTFPTYTGSGGYNNYGYLTLASSSIYTSSFTDVAQPFRSYIVFKSNSFTDSTHIFSLAATNGFMSQSAVSTGHVLRLNAGSQFNNQTNGGGTGSWELITSQWDGANSYIQVKNEPYKKGGYGSQGTSGGSAMNQIGFFPFNQVADVSIAEMIVVSGTISDTDDSNIRAFLTSKYAVSENKLLVSFGDSITTGALATDINAQGYITLLAQAQSYDYVNISYPGSNVYPHNGSNGVSGENLIDSYVRVSNSNTSFINGRFIFAYGTNDATQDAAWIAQYKSIVQVFLTAGVPANHITIVGQPNLPTASSTAQQTVASDLGLNFFDTNAYFVAHGGVPANMNVDGLHPNTTGHANMAAGLATYFP